MRIEADTEVCVAAGMCALSAPEIFDQDEDDGRVILLVERPGAANQDASRRAVSLCPSGALSIRND